MQITFVSNFINHHQMPFCEEMIKLCGENDSFTFIQTEEIAEERANMGWSTKLPPYVKTAYASAAENEDCRRLILDSDVVIVGGCEDDSCVLPRLELGKLTFRYSERLYREGQWKCITPRGLIKKYKDHTRFRNSNVYLLCAGGYVASDYGIIKAYPNKMYKWGYFPQVQKYDIEKLLTNKGYDGKPYILWVGRFLELKHAELALDVAKYLSEKNIDFHMDIIGGGAEEEKLKKLHNKYGLDKNVCFKKFMPYDQVRAYMEKADIFLFTSDRLEGWGAVLNESMNSGCAVVVDNMIGAAPYLVINGKNGIIYDDRNPNSICKKVENLILNKDYRQNLGRKAYETVINEWNPKNAARCLYELINSKINHTEYSGSQTGPCSKDYPRFERTISKSVLK